MKNNKLFWIIVGLFLAVAFYLMFIWNAERPKKYNWDRTLQSNKSQPYDLSVFYQSLQEAYNQQIQIIPEESSVSETLPLDKNEDLLYFYTGNTVYFSDSDALALSNFIKGGGYAFISVNKIPYSFLEKINTIYDTDIEAIYKPSISVHFADVSPKVFSFTNYLDTSINPNYWYYFSYTHKSLNTDSNYYTTPIWYSKIENEYPDFISIEHGEGMLFLHCNPVFLSNLYQKTPSGREYTQRVMEKLPKKKIWIDASGSIKKANGNIGYASLPVFRFIELNRPLYYAWWTLSIGVLLFLVFAGRRKQRVIPVLNAPGNNSLKFVQSIGYFYYSNKNNLDVFRKEWNHFVLFVKHQFHIQINNIPQKDIERLSSKSGVAISTIQTILDMHKKYNIYPELNNKDLKTICTTINTFYNEYGK